MVLIIIMAIISIVTTFFTYACDLLKLWELIPIIMLAIPSYSIIKKRMPIKIYLCWETFLFAIRYYIGIFIVKKRSDLITLPITVDQLIFKQFTGIITIGLFYVWIMYLFVYCYRTINRRLMRNKELKDFESMPTVTKCNAAFMFTAFIALIGIIVYNSGFKISNGIGIAVCICALVTIMVCYELMVSMRITEVKNKILDKDYQESLGGLDEGGEDTGRVDNVDG